MTDPTGTRVWPSPSMQTLMTPDSDLISIDGTRRPPIQTQISHPSDA
jgi:hypothetical protein